MLRHDDECSIGAEVTDTKLPRKATKLQVNENRTANRHRWVG